MLRIKHNKIDFGKQNAAWKMFIKRTSKANMRIKHSWDFNAQLYNQDLHKRKKIQKEELVLIWYMPRTNIKQGLHKKLMLPRAI
jgi:hypothetical protein